mgnify:CR=1 FL=1
MTDEKIKSTKSSAPVGYGEDGENENSVSQIDGAKATRISREYLEQNYGNVGMLYYRVENLERNGEETQYYVTCSLLSSFGSKERLYYRFKVNISDGHILEVWRSKPTNEEEAEIKLTKIKITEN